MENDIVESLRQLVCGEIDADRWINWWDENSRRLKTTIKPGQFLRLKPKKPGSFGPASRCVLASQLEAANLLQREGVSGALSDRYENEWQVEFATLQEMALENRKELEQHAALILKGLEPTFSKLAQFLRHHFGIVESIEPGASEGQIRRLESTLAIQLPKDYRAMLASARSLELGDILRIGLEHTTLLKITLPPDSAGDYLCLGDCWLQADGNQVLLDPSTGSVVYYSHSEPGIETSGRSFRMWIESIPDWDVWN
ncbi:MAG: SMI1/KNR4 family protein [Planctomycetota bacterium]